MWDEHPQVSLGYPKGFTHNTWCKQCTQARCYTKELRNKHKQNCVITTQDRIVEKRMGKGRKKVTIKNSKTKRKRERKFEFLKF